MAVELSSCVHCVLNVPFRQDAFSFLRYYLVRCYLSLSTLFRFVVVVWLLIC